MKTLFNSSTEYVMEMARRTMFTLQVVVIALAVPVFFATGITKRRHNNSPSQNSTEVGTSGQLSANPIATYTIVKI